MNKQNKKLFSIALHIILPILIPILLFMYFISTICVVLPITGILTEYSLEKNVRNNVVYNLCINKENLTEGKYLRLFSEIYRQEHSYSQTIEDLKIIFPSSKDCTTIKDYTFRDYLTEDDSGLFQGGSGYNQPYRFDFINSEGSAISIYLYIVNNRASIKDIDVD